MENVLERFRGSITTVNTDRDRIRIALLSAARESDFLLEATFNRRIARQCVPIEPFELKLLYPVNEKGVGQQQLETGLDIDWKTILRDFFGDSQNQIWFSQRGLRLMTYMMHTIHCEEFFTTTLGALQRSDLRRLGSLISDYEEPDAIYLNILTQEIADDITKATVGRFTGQLYCNLDLS